MKKIPLLIILLTCCPILVLSQPCFPDGILFSTQAQIDSFQINNPDCTEIEGWIIISGQDITNVDGLNVLTSIGDSLSIWWHSTFNSLEGFINITSIGGNLRIIRCDALSSLSGMDNLISIGGALILGTSKYMVYGNPSLTSLAGLGNLSSIGGEMKIVGNDRLKNLAGLDNLTSVGGDLIIAANDSLTSLSGLENLSAIGGNLRIGVQYLYPYGNASLIDLTGLESLGTVLADIDIIYNGALTSLTGLDNLDYIGGDLHFGDNYSLSHCAILSICNYLSNPNGTIEIEGNATGCNSTVEVQDSCIANGVSIEVQYLIEGSYVSPNPFTTSMTLSYTLEKPSTITINIFNPHGQLIERIEQEQPKGEQRVQWNAEGLPVGMYYFRIQAGDKVGGGKMVKMK